jgi:hypothetical protein
MSFDALREFAQRELSFLIVLAMAFFGFGHFKSQAFLKLIGTIAMGTVLIALLQGWDFSMPVRPVLGFFGISL